MKKLLWVLVVLIIVAFGGRAWYLHKQSVAEKDVVKIGALLPLTGPTARDGMDALAGMKIALEEINRDPTSNTKIDIWVEDNKFSVPASLAAFHKLNNSVPAFITFGAVPVNGLASLLKANHKPTISLVNAEDATIYSTPEIFRAWISISKQAGVIAEFVTKNFKDSRIAFLKIKSIDGDSFENVLTTQLAGIGQELVAKETFAVTDIETRNQVIKLLDKNPDVVVVYGFAQGYIAALNSLLEQGYKGAIITNQDVQMNHKLIANNAAGIYFGMPNYDFSKLIKSNPDLADNLFAAFGYEGMRIMAKVIQQNGTDSAKIREGLANLKDFETGFGKISYDEQGEIHLPNFVIKQMQADGSAKIVKESE
ncbi:MAG: ABC transporter substrate-binding protein [Alphaproteobacteria bacterium]|nr:ABC transporter substrate-binding protein [Alphaproteobacteria bacterium]